MSSASRFESWGRNLGDGDDLDVPRILCTGERIDDVDLFGCNSTSLESKDVRESEAGVCS